MEDRAAAQPPDLIVLVSDAAGLIAKYGTSEGTVGLGAYIVATPKNDGGQLLFYKRKLLGRNLIMALEDLDGSRTTRFQVSRSMLEMVRVPMFTDLPRFQDMVNSLILTKLVQRGHMLLHGALVNALGNGLFISSFPDVGKTTSTFLLSQEKGFTVLSDDITLAASNGMCSGAGTYHQRSQGGFDKVPIYTNSEAMIVEKLNAKMLKVRRTVAKHFSRLQLSLSDFHFQAI